MKIKIINYQRNGVSGDGFFVAKIMDGKQYLLATFETNDTDDHLRTETCRVIGPDDLEQGWRGDYYADEIQRAFRATNYVGFYDWMVNLAPAYLHIRETARLRRA